MSAPTTPRVIKSWSLDNQVVGRFKDFREDLGFSQKELAAALDLTQKAVSDIEGGKRVLRACELAALLIYTGRSFSDFWD